MPKQVSNGVRKPEKQSPLDRYITVLETVAAAPDANLSDLAELAGLPFSSMHRVLNTLIDLKLVVHKGGGRSEYGLGPRLLRLLHTGVDDAWLRISGQQIIDQLAEELDDTCFINKLVAKEVITVAWAAPENADRGYLVPGITQPLHASASAKAILAYQPLQFIKSALPARLPALCINTKTKLKDIVEEYELIRAQGYAACWNEFEPGVGAISCPVILPGADVIYSVGITGLIDRFSRHPIDVYTRAIRRAADAVGASIRGRYQFEDENSSLPKSGLKTKLDAHQARARSLRAV